MTSLPSPAQSPTKTSTPVTGNPSPIQPQQGSGTKSEQTIPINPILNLIQSLTGAVRTLL